MEISKGNFRIETNVNIRPTDIELISYNTDAYIIFKYNINSKIYYIQYYPDKKVQNHLFFEIINKSPLWIINYYISPYVNWNTNIYYFDVKFTIDINTYLISEYINTSMALNYIINDLYLQYPIFLNKNFLDQSIIPYIKSITPPKDFNIKLYDYQKKTLAKILQI